MASSAMDRFKARLEKTKEKTAEKVSTPVVIEEKKVEIVEPTPVIVKESGKSRLLRFPC